jgi:hypothetical protein
MELNKMQNIKLDIYIISDSKPVENNIPEIKCPIAKKIHEELEQHPELSVSVLEYINTLKFHLKIK